MKLQDSRALSSMSEKEPRKSQKNASLTATSARKSCNFLWDLIDVWHVIWYVSAGFVLGILRKHKRILHFCKRSCGDAHDVSTERSLAVWGWNLPFNEKMSDWSQAELAMWQCKLVVWVYDGTLKLGWSDVIWDVSVHVIDIDSPFFLFLC